MKITIKIKDSKVGFFLELLQSFDFISIEKTDIEEAKEYYELKSKNWLKNSYKISA